MGRRIPTHPCLRAHYVKIVPWYNLFLAIYFRAVIGTNARGAAPV